MFFISVHFKDSRFQHDELEAVSYEFKNGFLVIEESTNSDAETTENPSDPKVKRASCYYPVSEIHRLDIREI